MSFMKMAKTNNGLVWKGLRGGLKTTRRYIRSGARTVEFTLMTAMLATVGFIGYGQITGEGPKVSFDRGELVFVDYSESDKAVTILNNGVMEQYQQEYEGWSNLLEFEGPVISNIFLNRCEAFAKFHNFDSSIWIDSDNVPSTRILSWTPALVWPEREAFVPNTVKVEVETSDSKAL